jgi:hypothetical protein
MHAGRSPRTQSAFAARAVSYGESRLVAQPKLVYGRAGRAQLSALSASNPEDLLNTPAMLH